MRLKNRGLKHVRRSEKRASQRARRDGKRGAIRICGLRFVRRSVTRLKNRGLKGVRRSEKRASRRARRDGKRGAIRICGVRFARQYVRRFKTVNGNRRAAHGETLRDVRIEENATSTSANWLSSRQVTEWVPHGWDPAVDQHDKMSASHSS